MKDYDRVKLIVEKECYAKHSVHKGMDEWICDPRNIDGTWLVSFDQFGDKPNIATIAVKETDLKIISTSLIIQKLLNIGLSAISLLILKKVIL